MNSLIKDFQHDIIRSSKNTTELLRTAKLISVKLGLDDIAAWISWELGGYASAEDIPLYREATGGDLHVYNPYRGWMPVSHITKRFKVGQPISELEALVGSDSVVMPVPNDRKVKLLNDMGMDVSDWQQQIEISGVWLNGVLSAVKDKLLDWSLELEKRGIIGEDMSFNPEEKRSARNQTFHIQQFTGVLGNVSGSHVEIYNYSSLHQAIKDAGVTKDQRNELEDIMDQLKEVDPDKKKALMEKAKDWLVNNKEVLGTAASIVQKALGIGEDE